MSGVDTSRFTASLEAREGDTRQRRLYDTNNVESVRAGPATGWSPQWQAPHPIYLPPFMLLHRRHISCRPVCFLAGWGLLFLILLLCGQQESSDGDPFSSGSLKQEGHKRNGGQRSANRRTRRIFSYPSFQPAISRRTMPNSGHCKRGGRGVSTHSTACGAPGLSRSTCVWRPRKRTHMTEYPTNSIL
ncbi:hypothetical protein IWX50DRAFT_493991 [Phyllosticta citricarpa]